MKRLLLSAFACDPTYGSEPGKGWNYANRFAREGFEVHCVTRAVHQKNIELFEKPSQLFFHFISLPFGLEKLDSKFQGLEYIYYIIWQWFTFLKAKKLHEIKPFDFVHHATWGSLQLGSFLYKLDVPFIFGPAGGGQKASVAFRKYFGQYWYIETKREIASRLLFWFHPGFKPMLRKARSVLVSNKDTYKMAKEAAGVQNLFMSLDVSLPNDFFPTTFTPKKPVAGKLKLLWVGRFLPRKGLLLVLEVMNELKHNPNIQLTMVGDGVMMKTVVKKIDDLGLEKTVNLKGKVPFRKIKEFYTSHDVFFFTSLRETGGIQLIEAMAFGMPIVTIDLHGQVEIVNKQSGIRCACETPQIAVRELTNAIIKLYNNPEKVTEMSFGAYAFASEQTFEIKIKKIIQEHYLV